LRRVQSDCRGNVVVARLAGAGHALVELGNPPAVILVRLVLHLFSNRHQRVVIVQKGEAITDKSKDRIRPARFDPEDHYPRQQLMLDRKGNNTGIKLAKGHPPFAKHWTQPTALFAEQDRVISRLDEKSFGRVRRRR
jgi:hypothetical protein